MWEERWWKSTDSPYGVVGLERLRVINAQLVARAIRATGQHRLAIDMDGTAVSTSLRVAWAQRGYNPHRRKVPSYFPIPATREGHASPGCGPRDRCRGRAEAPCRRGSPGRASCRRPRRTTRRARSAPPPAGAPARPCQRPSRSAPWTIAPAPSRIIATAVRATASAPSTSRSLTTRIPRSRRGSTAGSRQAGGSFQPSATARSSPVRWRHARWFARLVAASSSRPDVAPFMALLSTRPCRRGVSASPSGRRGARRP